MMKRKLISALIALCMSCSNMTIPYMCETSTETIQLSAEHQAYLWADEQQCRALLPNAIIQDFEINNIFDLLGKNN